jgi:uncharacterized small protein (DUF1192 family)
MAVLVQRIRTLGVRLSEDEYSSLERFCVESGARSISDLARSAICSFMSHGNQQNALAATVNQNVAQVMELQQKIEILAAEIALFKANSTEKEDDKGREVKGSSSEPQPSPDKVIPDPVL